MVADLCCKVEVGRSLRLLRWSAMSTMVDVYSYKVSEKVRSRILRTLHQIGESRHGVGS